MVGTKGGELYVRIGGSDNYWQPSYSGYKEYREYARGADWKVWVGQGEYLGKRFHLQPF